MKRLNRILIFSTLFFTVACDKNFDQINTNPQAVNSVDPGLLFTSIERGLPGFDWLGESTIAQQFVLPYNLGVTVGYQFNENVDGLNRGPFGLYTGALKTIEHILPDLEADPSRSNFYNQVRILRALCYMYLVDHYGDVPYSEAGQALDGTFYPKYDKDEEIYADLRNEIKEATDALSASGDNTSKYDIFVAPGTSTADQVTKWKRFGYSLLLRLGMRYSKSDPNLAKTIVQEAFNGGVMQTNADNIYIQNMTDAGAPIVGYTNDLMGAIRNVNPFNYYLAEPFVSYLKSVSDPRLKYIAARYTPNQKDAPGIPDPDTTMADQFGFPVGYDDASVANSPAYRPAVGTGQDYSQINYNVVGNTLTPQMVITNAQTKLLLAEAAYRGWLTGGQSAQQYYEEGVRAALEEYSIFPNTAPISTAAEDAYLAMPGVAWDPAKALELINTQYWVESFNNGYEAWSNFRRSGYPALSPNEYNTNLNGGFIRRFAYPLREVSANSKNYLAAVASLGGADDLTTRIFWDQQ